MSWITCGPFRKTQFVPGKAPKFSNGMEMSDGCSKLCCRADLDHGKCLVCKGYVMHRTGASTLEHMIIQSPGAGVTGNAGRDGDGSRSGSGRFDLQLVVREMVTRAHAVSLKPFCSMPLCRNAEQSAPKAFTGLYRSPPSPTGHMAS